MHGKAVKVRHCPATVTAANPPTLPPGKPLRKREGVGEDGRSQETDPPGPNGTRELATPFPVWVRGDPGKDPLHVRDASHPTSTGTATV